MPSRVLQVEIVGNAAQLEQALGRAAGATKGFGAQVDALGTRMKSVGGALTRNLTLPIIGIGVVAGKMAVDFQQSMELIHTQAGVSQQAVDSMSKSVLKMGASVGTGPETLSTGLFHLASQGLRGAKAMEALKIAAEGAKVGQANLEDVTNALGATLVSGIKGAQNMSEAMGALNAVVGAGDMHMQDLADALGTGLPAKAALFGVSLQDAGAALAVFGDNNIRGAEAGTLFNSTLRVMGAESKAAAKVLATVGIGQVQLANDMRGPGGLVSALTDLKKHMEDAGLTASQQAALLTHAFGGRQAGGVMILIDQLDRLKAKERAVAAGAGGFGQAWLAETKTASFQFDQMKARLETVGISLGTELIPVGIKVGEVMTSAAQDVGGLVRGFEGLDSGTQHFIEEIGGVGLALGPGLNMTGRLIGSFRTLYSVMGGIGKLAGGGAGIGSAITIGVLGAAGMFEYLRNRENDAQRANDNFRHSLELLGDTLGRIKGLVGELGDAEARLPTDKLAVDTAKLAVQTQLHALGAGSLRQEMDKLVTAYDRRQISESQLISRADALKGLTASQREQVQAVLGAIDQQRVAERQLAGDQGRAAAIRKALSKQHMTELQQVAAAQKAAGQVAKAATDEAATAVRQRYGPAATQLGETLKQLASHSLLVNQAMRAMPVEAAKHFADLMQQDAAAAQKNNPLVATLVSHLSEYARVVGHVPNKVETKYILDPKNVNASLAQILDHLHAHVTTAGRLAITGGDKIASGFLSGVGKAALGVTRTMDNVSTTLEAKSKTGGDQAQKGFLTGIGKIVGGTVDQVGKAVGRMGSVSGQARAQGVPVGVAWDAGVGAGMAANVGTVTGAAVGALRAATAAAGAQLHGSGPFHFTNHEVGAPWMHGVAEGITSEVSAVAAAMSGGLSQAIAEQRYITVAGSILGQSIATSIAQGIVGKQPTVTQQLNTSLHAVLSERGDIAEASRVLGKSAAEQIAQGVLGYQPTLAAQLKKALRDAINQAMQAARQQVQSDMGSLLSAFSSLQSSALSAFDAVHGGTAKTRKEGSALTAEQKAAQAQQDAEQRAQLQRAIDQANQQLKADQASGADAQTIANDQQQIADATQQLADFDQAQKIKQDQEQYDKDVKRDKDLFEKRLAALQKEIKAHPERAKKIRTEIDNLFKQFGITPGALMQATDFNTSATLFTAGMGDLKKSMDALAKSTDKLADIESKTKAPPPPASGGMPHAATGGIFQDVPGGVIRVLEGGWPEGIVSLDPGKRTRSTAIWAQIGKHLNVPGFANGGIPGNPQGDPNAIGKGGPGDTPAMRAASMWLNDAGTDKWDKNVATALIGAIGPRAQAQAAMRHTYISGFGEVHQGSWRAPDPDPKMVTLLKASYPGLVFEGGTKGQQISAGQALSRITGGLGAVVGLIQASMGLAGTASKISKATSNAIHFEGAGGYLTDARTNPWKLTLAGLVKQYPSYQGHYVPSPFANVPVSGAFPDVAHFKAGGRTLDDGLAYLHRNEAIVPLDKPVSGGGTVHLHVEHLHVTGDLSDPAQRRQTARLLLDDMHSELRRKSQRVNTLGLK